MGGSGLVLASFVTSGYAQLALRPQALQVAILPCFILGLHRINIIQDESMARLGHVLTANRKFKASHTIRCSSLIMPAFTP